MGKDLLGDLYQRRPNMLLLAPLVNLEQVTADEDTLITLGMPIPGVCAVPARVLFLKKLVWRFDKAIHSMRQFTEGACVTP